MALLLERNMRELYDGARKVRVPVDALGRQRFAARVDAKDIEVRADGTVGFKGHAAVFNKRARIGGKRWGFWEEILPGAFAKTIGEADVRMLLNHDPNFVSRENRWSFFRITMGASSHARTNPRRSE